MYNYCVSTLSTCSASEINSQSFKMFISVFHVVGFTPFPFNQCWNMDSQHATGLFNFCRSIMSNRLPTRSKLSWLPTFLQSFATVSMILTRSPLGSLSSDSLSRETSSVSVILSSTVLSCWSFCEPSWAFSCRPVIQKEAEHRYP